MFTRFLIATMLVSSTFLSPHIAPEKKMVKDYRCEQTSFFQRLHPEVQAGVILLISGMLMKVYVESLNVFITEKSFNR